MSIISLQNRIFPKLSDDSGLAGGFQSGPWGAVFENVQTSAGPRVVRRQGPGGDVAILCAAKRFQRLRLIFLQLEQVSRERRLGRSLVNLMI